MRYTPRAVELTPVLLPPATLRLRWELHMVTGRDHALWRVEAHEGMNEELIGLGIYPCPPPTEWEALMVYARQAVMLDIEQAVGYIDPVGPDPFPVPRQGGAPAA
jgi:hypothetical protein